jgi:hypothetical protein
MTNQMNESITVKCKVEDIIAELKFLDVDGETMQHSREGRNGRSNVKQLIGSASGFSLHHYLHLRDIARKS